MRLCKQAGLDRAGQCPQEAAAEGADNRGSKRKVAPTELAGQLTAAALRPSSTPSPPSNKTDGRGTTDVLCGEQGKEAPRAE